MCGEYDFLLKIPLLLQATQNICVYCYGYYVLIELYIFTQYLYIVLQNSQLLSNFYTILNIFSLVGYLPFSTEYKDLSLRSQILSGKYFFSPSHWKNISLQAKLLMKRMLTVQVDRRITLDQILNHAWMQVKYSFT